MYDDEKGRGAIAEARELIEDYGKAEFDILAEPGSGVEVPVVRLGNEVQYVPPGVFDAYRNTPIRRVGTAELTRLESLIDHVNRFKDADSALFANEYRPAPSLTAVLDYHESVNAVRGIVDEVEAIAGLDANPRFGKHRSTFAFPLSDEWKAWTEHDGKLLKMGEFARFLEDRIIDVIDLIPNEDSPSEELTKFIAVCGGTVATAARLVELARGMQVFEEAVVTEAVNLSSGEGQIGFEVQHKDQYGGKLKIPNLFLIAIPVFQHGMLYRIAARLRYTKQPNGIFFVYELWRADNAFDNAFTHACQRVQTETALPLFYGSPEAG